WHVHDHQPGAVRVDHQRPDHQPAPDGDPRVGCRGETAGSHRRRHRHPAHGVPVDELGPPRDRRRHRGEVPWTAEGEPRDVGLLARAPGVPAGVRRGQLLQPEGLVPYMRAYEWMHEVAEQRARGDVPDTLILLEHPPTYTAGRRSDPAHLVWTRSQMEAIGAELHEVDRGGSVTFHGPGQLVGYPIVDLGARPDVMAYLRRLEEAVIRAARDVGIELHRDPKATGVWSGDRKV